MYLVQLSMKLEYGSFLSGGGYHQLRDLVNEMEGVDYQGGTLGELWQSIDKFEQELFERLLGRRRLARPHCYPHEAYGSVVVEWSWRLDIHMFTWELPADAEVEEEDKVFVVLYQD